MTHLLNRYYGLGSLFTTPLHPPLPTLHPPQPRPAAFARLVLKGWQRMGITAVTQGPALSMEDPS